MENRTDIIEAGGPTDGRLLRGARSRRAVLDRAVDDASVNGLEGLSFGRLALAAPVTKSGIAGLFGSKERLQLATVERAREIFVAAVVEPARASTEPGLPRLWALVTGWLAYSRDRVFDGGCFFRAAAAELDAAGAGPVRDAVVAAVTTWQAYLTHHVRLAIENGELAQETDPDQVVFELRAFLELADDLSVLLGEPRAYVRAERAARTMLRAHGAADL
ncbi:putative transcriptional regulator, TetR family [Xylanimonas cellulosilytica DSM 15894]|uniref:Transcriptional regulator, TetR family n=1 Tax=Xylanimonas cellulosilytica (strain DSM 15894 / JCM 12276 / CECT 5975 / KCTC 9989 / LMG 20990 / NBRC 107835 / XIL07) TaxID=446471 RepID=D1BT84_XYLCX|nr:TetR/AcrR family transcriptional regulator [Xylanimonas cellulosilytica]ACZ30926.1 putative transcriptional regulator, TetR family [Xylanimonas cellulosilytica DSM 15894]